MKKYIALLLLLATTISKQEAQEELPEGWVENPFVRCAPVEQAKAMLIGTWKPDHAVEKPAPFARDLSEKEMMSIQKFALVSINEKSFGDRWHTPCMTKTRVAGTETEHFRTFPNGFAPMGFPNESEIVYWLDCLYPKFIGHTRGYLAGPNDLLIDPNDLLLERSVSKTIKEQRENNSAEQRKIIYDDYPPQGRYYVYYKRVEAAAHDLPD